MGKFIIIALNYTFMGVYVSEKHDTETSQVSHCQQSTTHSSMQCQQIHSPESLSITHLLSPAPPRGAELSSLLDESSLLLDEDDDSSDPAAAQNFDMVAAVGVGLALWDRAKRCFVGSRYVVAGRVEGAKACPNCDTLPFIKLMVACLPPYLKPVPM